MKIKAVNSKIIFTIFFLILFAPRGIAQKETNIDSYDANIVSSWNKKIMEIAVAEDGLLTLKGLRTACMMHVAMHDALNSIAPRYVHYIYNDGKK